MYRIGLVVLGVLLLACNNGEKKESAKGKVTNGGSSEAFGGRFSTVSLPYQLADTTLLKSKDTAQLPADYLSAFLADTTLKNVFGKTKGISYSPLGKVDESGKDVYYIVKAKTGEKTAAFLLVFDRKGGFGASLPFLVPDGKTTTTQVSSIDKSFSIIKSITERNAGDVVGEGKDVVAYDAAGKKFSLIMTDLLHDEASLVNPLDTFPKTNKLAGDYYKNKQNLISVRDGRHPSQILVYIHTENSEGDCKGELKGEFILTSSKTAVYRQGGDPCILVLTFSGNKVSMNEERGCGNYRGLDCPLDGTFTRKKEEKPKETTKKTDRPKQAK